jgi:N6-adenosine-specific RNA methylase IME4
MSAAATPKPNKRLARLRELEALIERYLVGFMEVGKALTEVNSSRLYLETHPTFEAWVRDRFNIGRQRAYELMNATAVTAELEAAGVETLPVNERQVRPLSKLEPDARAEAWARANELAGDGDLTEKHVKRALREHNRDARLQQLADISKGNRPLSSVEGGPFNVVLSDPAWEYDSGTTDPTRVIENQYTTMPTAEILALPVSDCCADDAMLFLWVTAPLLEVGFAVLNRWGFSYVTNAVWDKEDIGMGYTFRIGHEHLLVGERGSVPRPSPEDRVRSIIRARRSDVHSQKPGEVVQLLERWYPGLPKLEMFCREPREGWSVWGNQSDAGNNNQGDNP